MAVDPVASHSALLHGLLVHAPSSSFESNHPQDPLQRKFLSEEEAAQKLREHHVDDITMVKAILWNATAR